MANESEADVSGLGKVGGSQYEVEYGSTGNNGFSAINQLVLSTRSVGRTNREEHRP